MNILSIKKQMRVEDSVIDNHAEDCTAIKADISEKEAATLTLYDNGMIHTCNQTGGKLFGCAPSEVTGQHITRLLPQLAGVNLVQGKRANSYLRFLSRVGHHFEVVSMSGAHFASKLFFSDVENLGRHHLRVIIHPAKQESS